jgi:hypothetical protein
LTPGIREVIACRFSPQSRKERKVFIFFAPFAALRFVISRVAPKRFAADSSGVDFLSPWMGIKKM